MKRRAVRRTAAVVVGAGLVALPVTAPNAFAARGGLVVAGTVYHDPHGCVEVGGNTAARPIENHTDAVVLVYYGRGCLGEVTASLAPREIRAVTGTSIHVP
ncbi:hypothetical protein [Nocardia donostiensis]|nr:hypothetical protein [Nocardia donostiensis]